MTLFTLMVTDYVMIYRPDGCDHRFLDVGDDIVTSLIDVEMRKVGNLGTTTQSTITVTSAVICRSVAAATAILTVFA